MCGFFWYFAINFASHHHLHGSIAWQHVLSLNPLTLRSLNQFHFFWLISSISLAFISNVLVTYNNLSKQITTNNWKKLWENRRKDCETWRVREGHDTNDVFAASLAHFCMTIKLFRRRLEGPQEALAICTEMVNVGNPYSLLVFSFTTHTQNQISINPWEGTETKKLGKA